MKRIAVIGSLDFCIGFKLVGLRFVYPVQSQSQFEKKLEEIMENENIGIVFSQQEFMNKLSWRMKKYLDEKTYPVIVSFPLEAKESGEDLNELIKKALGFEIKE